MSLDSRITDADISHLPLAQVPIMIDTLVYAQSNIVGTHFLMRVSKVNKLEGDYDLVFYDISEMKRYIHQGGRIHGTTNKTWRRHAHRLVLVEDENEITHWLR